MAFPILQDILLNNKKNMMLILFQVHNFYEYQEKNIEIFFGKFFGRGLIRKNPTPVGI